MALEILTVYPGRSITSGWQMLQVIKHKEGRVFFSTRQQIEMVNATSSTLFTDFLSSISVGQHTSVLCAHHVNGQTSNRWR